MDTPAPLTPPPVPSQSRQKDKSFITSKVFLIFIILFILSLLGSGSYILNSQPQATSSKQQREQVKLPTIVSNILNPNPTAEWETFTNTDYGYTIKYPKDKTIWGDPEYMDSLTFGEHIDIVIFDKDLSCGYCIPETLTATVSAKIGGIDLKKISGKYLSVDEEDYYEPPESFIRYEFIRGNFLYQFEVTELAAEAYNEYYVTEKYPPNRTPGEVPEKELEILEQMLTTLSLTDPKRTEVKYYNWEEDYLSPSPVDEPWDNYKYPDFDPSLTPIPPSIPIPTTDKKLNNDITRRVHVNIILNAVMQYIADNNDTYPEEIKATFLPISVDGADLCELLTPTYVGSLPVDPSLPKTNNLPTCKKYNTGYEIKIDAATDEIVVRAPKTEGDEIIQVSR